MYHHNLSVSPLDEVICSPEQNTQPSEPPIVEKAFDFDIEAQQHQAARVNHPKEFLCH